MSLRFVISTAGAAELFSKQIWQVLLVPVIGCVATWVRNSSCATPSTAANVHANNTAARRGCVCRAEFRPKLLVDMALIGH